MASAVTTGTRIHALVMMSEPVASALFVDFDGTLLDTERRVSTATTAALQRLVDSGWLYIPASSRPILGVRFAELPPPRYIVALNGAVVYDAASDVVHVRATIRSEALASIVDLAPPGTVANIYTPTEWFANDVRSRWVQEEERRIRGRVAPWDGRVSGDACKCLVLGASPDLDVLEGRLDEQQLGGEGVIWFRSESEYLEIGPVEASKGAAVGFVRLLHGGELFCVAVGDGPADVSLLEASDVGVAVGNARPEVRAVAYTVVPSNTEGGVKVLLEALIDGRLTTRG